MVLVKCFDNCVLHRDEEKNHSFIDRKCTSKESASSSKIVNHNRTMTQANQSVELDSTSSYMLQKSGGSSSTKTSEKRDIEVEAAAHLLTKQEKSLCLQLDLKPTQYLTQKTLLVQVSGIHNLVNIIVRCIYY